MNADIMNKIGVKARAMIRENVAQGVDIDGQQYSYSTKPFVRPWAKSKLPKKEIEGFVQSGRIKPFRTKAGKLWMLITGGYRDYRRMRGQNDTGDFLTDTGAMLRNLKTIETTAESVKLGFTGAVQLKKALWFNVMGVGKSKKLWKFMGLRTEQEAELAEYAAGLITQEIVEAKLIKVLGDS